MNEADIGIAIIMLWSILTSLLQDITTEVFTLITWLFSLEVAIIFSADLARLLATSIPFIDLQLGLALALLFFTTFIIFLWLNYLIVSLFNAVRPTSVEYLLLGLFGFIQGSTFVIFLMFLAGLTQITDMMFWKNSFFIQKFKPIVLILYHQMPAHAIAQFNF